MNKFLLILMGILALSFSNPSNIAFSQTENSPYDYEGATNTDGLYEGIGKLFYKEKILYEGQFRENQFDGEGILYYVSSANNKEDVNNEHLLTNKKKYEGTFLNGKYHGKGTLYYETAITTTKDNQGLKYQGKFSYGEYNGYGIEYTMDGNVHRQGYFLNGNLYKYKGETDENKKMNGKGQLLNENDEIMFEGTFQHGEIHGQGILYNSNRTMRYEGNFVNNLLQGEGKVYVNDKLYYEGTFKDGLLEGDGDLYLPTGKIGYQGPFSYNRTEEQPFQVKAELTLNANMSATYSLYIVLLADYLTDDNLAYLSSLEEMAAPHFDSVKRNESKKEKYVAIKAIKDIDDINEVFYDDFFGFNVVIDKKKLMIFEEYKAYAYLSVLHDPNLMNVSYEINLPNGANEIRADGMSTELVPNEKYGWIDINDTNYKVIEFQRRNNLNLFISAAFFIVLLIGIVHFRRKDKKKRGKKKKSKKANSHSPSVSKGSVNELSMADETDVQTSDDTKKQSSDD